MSSAQPHPAGRPNPAGRFRSYRRYHPDLRPYALALPRETVGARTLPLMRRLAARTRPHPAAEVTDLGGGARVRVFGDTDRRAPGPALLWIHGGGFVFGHAAQDDRWCHQIATRTGVLVASVDYRLAPEHPYPAALHDCHRALQWLADLPGVDPGRVVLAGTSAGADPAHAAPAHRHDLAGLPPAWIIVGDQDQLHAQNARYHQALTAAGVDSRLTVVPGAFHGFDAVAAATAISRDLRRDLLHTIHTAVTTPPR